MPGGNHLNHSCGIFGIWDHEEASRFTYLGLFGQQHRGQESCGISSTDGQTMVTRKGMGLVAQYFDESRMSDLIGDAAIGHVRYSTSGSSVAPNAQPIYFDTHRGPMALAHNGNLVNAAPLRQQLGSEGTIFMTDSDSEMILHLIAQSSEDGIVDAVIDALADLQGAYSTVLLTPKMLMAIRDPYGFRPLVMGKLNGKYIFASESTTFDLMGAELIDELQPGEIRYIDAEGLKVLHPFKQQRHRQCIFEHVYFARPDSKIFNALVHSVRTNLGRNLAQQTANDLDLDAIIPIPDGGVYIALGYCDESGIPFHLGLVRNHYVGRTFIEPEQGIRDFGVKVKLNPIRDFIRGKRIGLVDDSIVRGTTSKKIVEMILRVGAREVHYLVGSPPYISPCYYGIDTPEHDQLIANHKSTEEIRQRIGADSLHYLNMEGLLQSVSPHESEYCTSCFTGKYPTPTPEDAQAFPKARRRSRNIK